MHCTKRLLHVQCTQWVAELKIFRHIEVRCNCSPSGRFNALDRETWPMVQVWPAACMKHHHLIIITIYTISGVIIRLHCDCKGVVIELWQGAAKIGDPIRSLEPRKNIRLANTRVGVEWPRRFSIAIGSVDSVFLYQERDSFQDQYILLIHKTSKVECWYRCRSIMYSKESMHASNQRPSEHFDQYTDLVYK